MDAPKHSFSWDAANGVQYFNFNTGNGDHVSQMSVVFSYNDPNTAPLPVLPAALEPTHPMRWALGYP